MYICVTDFVLYSETFLYVIYPFRTSYGSVLSQMKSLLVPKPSDSKRGRDVKGKRVDVRLTKYKFPPRCGSVDSTNVHHPIERVRMDDTEDK